MGYWSSAWLRDLVRHHPILFLELHSPQSPKPKPIVQSPSPTYTDTAALNPGAWNPKPSKIFWCPPDPPSLDSSTQGFVTWSIYNHVYVSIQLSIDNICIQMHRFFIYIYILFIIIIMIIIIINYYYYCYYYYIYIYIHILYIHTIYIYIN